MSEEQGGEVEGEGGGGGLQVGILDVVVLARLLVFVVAVVMRFRRKRLEEQNSLRNLKVLSR